MTLHEWQAEGERRFGPDYKQWKFVCPVCGHVQSVEDFKQYRDKGAEPNMAYSSCIGRFIEGSRSAFRGSGDGPCTYTGGGLFQVNPVSVDDGERVIQVFDFTPEQEGKKP